MELDTGRTWRLPVGDDPGEVRWSHAGDAIEYRTGDSLMAVPVDVSSGFRTIGRPELIARLPQLAHWIRTADGSIYYSRQMDVQPDAVPDGDSYHTVQVVVNWFAELERMVPTGR